MGYHPQRWWRATGPRHCRWRPNSSWQRTVVTIDLLQEAVPVDPPSCDDGLPALICGECIEGIYSQIEDDERCGVISCAAFEGFRIEGTNSWDATSSCIASVTEDIDDNRCAALGECIEANTALCPTTDDTLLQADPCEKIINCGFGTPELEIAPDGSPCGVGYSCVSGIVSRTKNLSPSRSQNQTQTRFPRLAVLMEHARAFKTSRPTSLSLHVQVPGARVA